jgi:four helix bundle protein
MQELDHAKLDVYRCSLDLLEVLDSIAGEMPAGRAHLKDQLDRAGTSIVLNIAEGAGEFSAADKKRFYRMARRSATEVGAIVDILKRRRLVREELLGPALELLVRVVSMLAKLAMRLQPELASAGSDTKTGHADGDGTWAGAGARKRTR